MYLCIFTKTILPFAYGRQISTEKSLGTLDFLDDANTSLSATKEAIYLSIAGYD